MTAALVLEWGVAALGGGAAALWAWGLSTFYRDTMSGAEAMYGTGRGEALPPFLRALLPYGRALASLLAPLLSRVGGTAWERMLEGIEKLLRRAGRPGELDPAVWVGMSGVGAIAGLVAGFAAAAALDLSHPFRAAFPAAGGVTGGLLPWIWLRDSAARRQHAILRALPYALDLLTLSVEAGLDFVVAIARIVDRLGSTPLGHELRQMLRELQMGKSRKEALRDLKGRVALMDMDFFVSALVQADEMGAGIGPVLRAQADGIRERRFQRAEELAAKAPVKIIFPLMAFILPVTLVVILGPLAIQLLDQFRSMAVR